MAIVNKDEPAPVIVASPSQTPDDPAVVGEVVEEDTEDVIEDEFSLMVMKLLGIVILVFTIIELGVGGAAYGALYNERYGGWWICFLSVPAGVGALLANKRIWVTATVVLAILAAILAFISTVIDGIAATKMRTFVTCSSWLAPYNYAALSCASNSISKTSYSYSQFKSISDICSCFPKGGNSCYAFYVSNPVGSVKSCDDMLTSFPMLLDASTIFSTLLLITTIGLSTVGIMILTCPAGYMGGEKKTEEVPDNNAVPPDNGLVGVNGNSDAV